MHKYMFQWELKNICPALKSIISCIYRGINAGNPWPFRLQITACVYKGVTAPGQTFILLVSTSFSSLSVKQCSAQPHEQWGLLMRLLLHRDNSAGRCIAAASTPCDFDPFSQWKSLWMWSEAASGGCYQEELLLEAIFPFPKFKL